MYRMEFRGCSLRYSTSFFYARRRCKSYKTTKCYFESRSSSFFIPMNVNFALSRSQIQVINISNQLIVTGVDVITATGLLTIKSVDYFRV